MLHKASLYNWFFGVAGFALVSGCSLVEPSKTSYDSHSKTWGYQRELTVPTFPDGLSQLTNGKVTIKGSCHFSPELINAYRDKQQMILMPFLIPLADGSFGPDFNGSRPIYESLQNHLNLVSSMESIQLFQRWISSVEHACPAGLNRNVSQCSLKNIYSVSKLWGGDKPRLHNFERLNLWLEQRNHLRFIVLPSFSILNSEAAQNLRYSTNSAPIVKKSTFERRRSASSYIGQPSLDWIPLTDKGRISNELASAGRCSVVWQELEVLKRTGSVDYQKLVTIEKTMRSVLLSFMNDVFQQADLKQN